MTGSALNIPVGPGLVAPPSYAYCSSQGLKGYALTLGEARVACERAASGPLEWVSALDNQVARDPATRVLYVTSFLPG